MQSIMFVWLSLLKKTAKLWDCRLSNFVPRPSPRKVTYRRRFAIESSYRMRNQVKPKTSSKNATIRYFYALISFLFENIWLCLQRKYFTIVKT